MTDRKAMTSSALRRRRQANKVSVELLHELFILGDDGALTWRATMPGRAVAGKRAGTAMRDGRRHVKVGGVSLYEHRIVFAMARGDWPVGHIDHIDGDPTNNRPDNLRDVSRAVNLQNQRRAHRGNSAGLLGVSRDKTRWRAQIRKSGKSYYLGGFSTPEEAHAAYVEAKRKIHEGCTL